MISRFVRRPYWPAIAWALWCSIWIARGLGSYWSDWDHPAEVRGVSLIVLGMSGFPTGIIIQYVIATLVRHSAFAPHLLRDTPMEFLGMSLAVASAGYLQWAMLARLVRAARSPRTRAH